MSSNNVEDDNLSARSLEETDSPRKRMRLENSSRKGWSLMDRRTDQEVLQEMGVSLLEPDDAEQCDASVGTPLKASMKRKYDIENVNPNTCSPSPGPARGRSPRSTDKSKALKPTDQQALETTLLSDYLIDEETPLAQMSALCSPLARYCPSDDGRLCYKPLPIEEEVLISKRPRCEPVGEDSFSVLSDEMLLSVFRWLTKRTLAHCMMVCKRWHRVACDETLWTRLDLGNKTLAAGALGKVLARKPLIVRLAVSEIGPWHPPPPPAPARLQYLDLSIASVDARTLACLLQRCPLLKKLSVESVAVDEDACRFIGKCTNLETLNLTMAQGITVDGLRHMLEGCTNLQALNISWTGLSEEALELLVSGLPPRLQRLNVSGARVMTDEMVEKLVSRCPRLLELDVSDCSRLGPAAVRAVMTLGRLEHLALSRCYLLPPHLLTKLGSMPALQYVDVWGMLPSASLAALRAALPALQLNQFMFSAVARPTVGTRRTSIWGLRTRD